MEKPLFLQRLFSWTLAPNGTCAIRLSMCENRPLIHCAALVCGSSKAHLTSFVCLCPAGDLYKN
jgi:hypothetical protein